MTDEYGKENLKVIKPNITDITKLRDHSIRVLEKLDGGAINIAEAGVAAKLSETIIATVKLQLDIARMFGRKPNIEFIGDCLSNEELEYPTKRITKKDDDE